MASLKKNSLYKVAVFDSVVNLVALVLALLDGT
jgi:hypothetical protein